MVIKEVKEYKRWKGLTYRINIAQTDDLRGEVCILKKEEYNKLVDDLAIKEKELEKAKQTSKNELEETERKLRDSEIEIKTLKENQDEFSNLKEDYQKLLNDYHKSVDDTSVTIANLTKQLNNAIDDKNTYKDTIEGLRILVGMYENRGFFDRLINKKATLDSKEHDLLKYKED